MEDNLNEIKEELEKMDVETLKKSLIQIENFINRIEGLKLEVNASE